MALKQMAQFATELNTLVNTHSATYQEFSDLVGGAPLTDITDAQVDTYFNGALDVSGRAIVLGLLSAMENVKQQKDTVSAGALATLDKLTG